MSQELILKANAEMKEFIASLMLPTGFPKTPEDILATFVEFGEEVQDALADGKLSVVEVFRLGGKLVSIGKGIYEEWQDGALCETVVLILEKAFDLYVVPFDIPFVPDGVETAAEAFVRGLIRPAIETLFGVIQADEDETEVLPDDNDGLV